MKQLNSKIITKSFEDTTAPKDISESKRSAPNVTDQFTITDCHYLESHKIKSRVDFLTIQFKPKTENEFNLTLNNIHQYLLSLGLQATSSKPNLKYFDEGMLLQAIDETKSYCGSLKWRHCFSVLQLEITGKGCSYINTQEQYFFPLLELSQTINAEIRRIDLAVDSFTLKHGLRYMQQAYSRGLYSPASGVKPNKETIATSSGKSIIIGSRHSTKQILGYEKGKHGGFPKNSDEYKKWFRFEVRLRSRTGQTIPLEVLLNPDEYFVGAYPKANARILKDVLPRSIKREVLKTVDKSLNDKLDYARHQIGKTIYGAVNRGMTDEVIVSKIIRKGKKDNIAYPSFITQEDLNNYPFG
ncbi:MAG: replication initiation factor domain-containing protein [Thalassotalea sp.]